MKREHIQGIASLAGSAASGQMLELAAAMGVTGEDDRRSFCEALAGFFLCTLVGVTEAERATSRANALQHADELWERCKPMVEAAMAKRQGLQ